MNNKQEKEIEIKAFQKQSPSGIFQLWRNGELIDARNEVPKLILQHGEDIQECDEPGWIYLGLDSMLICHPCLYVKMENVQ